MPPVLIPPDVRSRLQGLRLDARRAMGGNGIGTHRSRSRGAGLEFSQYRAYEPGDEPRQIDWKLYGRSDRFFVREAERESPLTAWLLIDASASMRQADRAAPDRTRLDAAKGIAACIAELALRQGDRFGMIGLREDGLRLLPPSHGPRGRDRLWLALHALDAQGGFPPDARLGAAWERIAAHDLVILLSDGFDDGAVTLAERLAAAGREVLFVQVLTVEERDFPFDGGHLFRDPETGQTLPGDGRAMRAGYLQRFAEAQRALDARLDAAGIVHARHVMDEPLDRPLRQLFGRPVQA
jgi:uncharacterized protein (DUF58 family)